MMRMIRKPVLAVFVLTALLVPQGMAYAELAGLPAVTGLYATLVPLVAYAVFGPSRILVLGPDSAVAPLVAASVIPLAGADAAERTALAGGVRVKTQVRPRFCEYAQKLREHGGLDASLNQAQRPVLIAR